MASFLLLFGGSESCPAEARYQEPLVQARGQAPLCISRVEGLQCIHVYAESIPEAHLRVGVLTIPCLAPSSSLPQHFPQDIALCGAVRSVLGCVDKARLASTQEYRTAQGKVNTSS